MSDSVSLSPPPVILFGSERAANFSVAGIPAAVRAMLAAISASGVGERAQRVQIAVPGGWTPSDQCLTEAARLLPVVALEAVDADRVQQGKRSSGVGLLTASSLPAGSGEIDQLRRAGAQIVAATGKPGDGIVSRHINRPISRALTGLFLLWPGARPWHATLAAALIGAVMLVALFLGGERGLLAGAILFQVASIVDGVDGEVARATMRSSKSGAMMDSLTDAATNLGFIAGVSFNLYSQGAGQAATAGAIGCSALAMGSMLLAVQSRRDGGDFTFDALKTRFRAKPSRLKQWLTWIAMRDFYALASCIAVLAGWASYLMYTFAIVASGWLVMVAWMFLGNSRFRR